MEGFFVYDDHFEPGYYEDQTRALLVICKVDSGVVLALAANCGEELRAFRDTILLRALDDDVGVQSELLQFPELWLKTKMLSCDEHRTPPLSFGAP